MSSAVLFFQTFSTGLLAPVLSLMLMSRGLGMNGLALIMGLYSMMAVALELPSGILADLMGRKKTFLMAQGTTALSIIFILNGSGVFLAFGAVFMGVGRALSSGTLDALYIEQSSQTLGMEKTVARVSLLDGTGLAAGSIIGGLLPLLSQKIFPESNIYNLGLMVRLIITVLIAALTVFYIKEPREALESHKPSLKTHLMEGLAFISSSKLLQFIFISVFTTGFLLFPIETYWQPAFTALPSAHDYLWLLGIISFMFFCASTVGTLLASKALSSKRISPEMFYIASRILSAGAVIAFASAKGIPAFAVFLITHYLFLGVSGLPEGVLINKTTPSSKRSSILSLTALIMQLGGLTGSLFGGIFAEKISIKAIWLLGASLVAFSAAVFGWITLGRKGNPIKEVPED